MSWLTVKLDKIAEFNLGKMLDQKKNKGELLPYLANVNVRWGEFDLKDIRYMRFELHEIERFSLKRGDIVMCEGGEPGRCAIWMSNQSGMMFQKALHRIRARNGIDAHFLFYCLLNKAKTGGFVPFFTGATIKHLPREQLARVELSVPDEDTQRRIGLILSTYDDLIETNRRRIALLEESARLLYREWFVKLRFSGHESAKWQDALPEGWQLKKFGEVVDAIGGATPNTKRMDFWDGNIVWLTPTDVTRNDCLFLPDSARKITESGYESCSTSLLPAGTIFMTSRASIGYFALLDQPACTNQGFIAVIPKIENTRNYFLFNLMSRVEEFEAKATGSTFKELSKKAFRELPVIVPNCNILEAFENATQPIIEQVIALKKQTILLITARDELLPKLMSGAIQV
ncbi:MAG: restriction endonuclease subunit S [Methylobacter sp.]